MIPLRTSEVVGYLVLQYGLWFLLVYGAAAGYLWWPAIITAVILVAACWRASTAWWRVAAVIAVGVLCALSVDGSLIKTGLVGYSGGDPSIPIPPAWIIALWAMFAATLALPARQLLTNPILGGVLGGIGGAVAYAGGRALGSITVSNTGLIVVGVFFALATPVIVLAANKLLPVPERPRRSRP